jgi:glycosyltransferase involved in cell wall biosynthesis
MRVTFVLPYAGLSGGIRVAATYAERLQRRGHDVTVVSVPQVRKSFLAKSKSLLRGRGWPKDREPQPSYFGDIAVPHRVLESARPVVDEDVPDADVVLATFWRTAPWVAALSPRKGVKAILLQGYETSPGRENPEIDAAWRLPLRKIVISEWMVDMARDRFDDSDVHLIPNSVDTQQFNAPPRGKQAAPTIGMLYSTVHTKGVDVALAALERVRQKMNNLRVLAFGAHQLSARLPLPDWVEFQFQPPQSALRHIYDQCDVWLCASRREGFHLPPLEAMACRCPVVSTRVGGPLDTVQDAINGYLVEIEDVGGLAMQLTRVLALNDIEWRRMSDAALATATHYTWDDATDLLEDSLRTFVNTRRLGAIGA